MAATDLLDYNQIVEQSPSTGDSIPDSGGLLTWNFRCDPNLSWDPSQTFFTFDVRVDPEYLEVTRDGTTGEPTALEWKRDVNADGTSADTQKYFAGPTDWYPFFLHRALSSITHIIDGVTVANSNQPFADKIMQEKYLTESTMSNYGNFESIMLTRAIDDGTPDHNIFLLHTSDDRVRPEVDSMLARLHRLGYYPNNGRGFTQSPKKVTIMFQPPFDFWTKHQRVSGGNHQVQMNVRAKDSTLGWGTYCNTYQTVGTVASGSIAVAAGAIATGLTAATNTSVNAIGSPLKQYNGTVQAAFAAGKTDISAGGEIVRCPLGYEDQTCSNRLVVTLDKPRLFRRMVRYTIERPISVQEFNCTEMQFYHGQATTKSMTQNFLLPSSTFGIAFYWRDASDSQYTPFLPYHLNSWQGGSSPHNQMLARVDQAGAVVPADANQFYRLYDTPEKIQDLNEFYFTYGGETYPSQRLTNLKAGVSATVHNSDVTSFQKMQMIAHQLQGVYNTDMERFNASFAGKGLLDRMDGEAFFFPVAKHNNSDNSDLQVHYDFAQDVSFAGAATNVSLVVVAFYDARVELAYNSMNQLEKVTKTEWR